MIADTTDEFTVSQRSSGSTDVEIRWHIADDDVAADAAASKVRNRRRPLRMNGGG